MYTDQYLIMSESQAITTGSVISTGIIDLQQNRDIGEGQSLSVAFTVPTGFAGGTSLQADVITSTNVGLTGTPIVIGSTGPVATANLAYGTLITVVLNPLIASVGEQFIGIRYTAVGTFTAGNITANVVLDIQDGKTNYPSGFSVI